MIILNHYYYYQEYFYYYYYHDDGDDDDDDGGGGDGVYDDVHGNDLLVDLDHDSQAPALVVMVVVVV